MRLRFSGFHAHRRPSVLRSAALALVVLLFSLGTSHLSPRQERRLRTGLDLFPSFLAADLDLDAKRDPAGELVLVLLYINYHQEARELARQLGKFGTIRKLPFRVEVTNDVSLSSYAQHPPAGIFLTEPFQDELASVLRYAEAHRVLVFSPFVGDVERGVPGGVFVSDRILPHVNIEALEAAAIRLKPFFLQIAERYE